MAFRIKPALMDYQLLVSHYKDTWDFIYIAVSLSALLRFERDVLPVFGHSRRHALATVEGQHSHPLTAVWA